MTFKKIVIALFLLMGCARHANNPQGTDLSSGGGSGVVADFFMHSNKTLELIARQNPIVSNGIVFHDMYQRMHAVIAKMQVQVTNRPLYIQKTPVSAINYPTQFLVIVNVTDWRALSDDDKLLLTTHELLALTFSKSEIDDTTFSVSRQILAKNSAGDFFSAPQTDLQRREYKNHLRDQAANAAAQYSFAQGLTDLHLTGERAVIIIKNVVSPSDVDNQWSLRAELQLRDGNDYSDPYSLVEVYLKQDSSNIVFVYEVRLMPDFSVVSTQIIRQE
jgi:hypothetical protein